MSVYFVWALGELEGLILELSEVFSCEVSWSLEVLSAEKLPRL